MLQASFMRVAAMVASGRVAPIQALSFPFGSIMTALRQFAHAKHIGKIVTEMPPASQSPLAEQVFGYETTYNSKAPCSLLVLLRSMLLRSSVRKYMLCLSAYVLSVSCQPGHHLKNVKEPLNRHDLGS